MQSPRPHSVRCVRSLPEVRLEWDVSVVTMQKPDAEGNGGEAGDGGKGARTRQRRLSNLKPNLVAAVEKVNPAIRRTVHLCNNQTSWGLLRCLRDG